MDTCRQEHNQGPPCFKCIDDNTVGTACTGKRIHHFKQLFCTFVEDIGTVDRLCETQLLARCQDQQKSALCDKCAREQADRANRALVAERKAMCTEERIKRFTALFCSR